MLSADPEIARPSRHAPSATLAVWVALALGVIAAFFSQGYLDADDDLATLDIAGRWLGSLKGTAVVLPVLHHSPLWAVLVCLVLRLPRLMGVLDPARQMIYLRLFMAGLGALVVWTTGRHALAYGRPRGSLLARWLTGSLCFMPFLFVHPLSSVACLLPITGALYKLDPAVVREPGWKRMGVMPSALLGGAYLGIATVLRYELILMLPAVIVALSGRRGYRALGLALLGFSAALILEGFAGMLLWGRWFAPELQFLSGVRAGLGSDLLASFAARFPLKTLAASCAFVLPPLLLLLLYGVVRGSRTAWFPAACAGVYLVGVCLLGSGGFTSLVPALPLLFLLAGMGLAREGMGGRLRGWRWVWGFGLAANVVLLPFWLGNSPHHSYIEALRAAASRSDTRGVLILHADADVSEATAELPVFFLFPRVHVVSLIRPADLAGESAGKSDMTYGVMYGQDEQVSWLVALHQAGYRPAVVRTFGASPLEALLNHLHGDEDPAHRATLYTLAP